MKGGKMPLNKVLPGPKTIYMDITTSCNIACNYCYNYSPLIAMKNRSWGGSVHISFKEVKQIVSQAYGWEVQRIAIMGKGEPSCHPEFREILAFLVKTPYKISLSSNATFSSEICRLVSEIEDIGVTLSAPNEILFNTVQTPPRPLFKKVVSNVKILNKIRKNIKCYPFI